MEDWIERRNEMALERAQRDWEEPPDDYDDNDYDDDDYDDDYDDGSDCEDGDDDC